MNERDGLGDETPPDYLTSVSDGGFYGWPYCYWGQTVDERVPQDAALVARADADYALGGHTASLGLCWMPAGTLPGRRRRHGDRPARLVEPQHAERLPRVVFVPFADAGLPAAARHPVGFLAPTNRSPMAGRWAWRSAPTAARCWWPTTSATMVWRVSSAAPAPDRRPPRR